MSIVPLADLVAEVTSGDWGDAEPANHTNECIVLRGTDFQLVSRADVSHAPHRYLRPASILKRRLRPGDLLVEMSGGSESQPTGRLVRITDDMAAVATPITFSNFVKRLRLTSNVDSSYFALAWESLYRLGKTRPYEKRTTGIRNFRLDDFLSSEAIPLPSLEEQRRVAWILKTIQRSIDATTRSLSVCLDTKLSMVAREFHLPQYPLVECRGLCDVLSVGIVVRPTQYYSNSGVIALRSLNVKEDEIDLTNTVRITPDAHAGAVAKSALRSGDVVIVRTGYPGTSAVIPPELPEVNCIDLVFARPGSLVRPEFLSRFFNSPSGRKQALHAKTGMAQQHLNVAAVGRTKLPLPPVEIQDQIIDRLRAVDRSVTATRNKRRSLEGVLASAMGSLLGSAL